MTFVQRWRNDLAGPVTSISATVNPTGGRKMICYLAREANADDTVTWTDGGSAATGTLRIDFLNAGQLFKLDVFVMDSVASGSRAIQASWTTGRSNVSLAIEEHSSLDTFIAAGPSGANFQSSPGTGAGAITSGNINVTSQPAWLVGVSADWGVGNASNLSAANGNNNGTGWLYGSNDYARFSDRRVTATGNAALTFTTGTNEAHFTAALAFTESSSGPDVTDVDTDETVTSTQTNIVITGTAFNSAAVTIEQGSTVVTQSIDSQNATTIQFDMVFDSGSTDLRYGAATLRVTNTGGANDTISITIAAPSGRSFVNLGTPNTTAANRITAISDLASGDQLEISNVVGGSITDVTVNTDATFDVTVGVTSFQVRAWDVSDSTWGSLATQTVATTFPGSVGISFGVSGTLTNGGGGALSSTIPLAIALAPTLRGNGPLASTIAMSMTPAFLLRGNGALATTLPLAMGASGQLSGNGALASVITLSCAVIGLLRGSGALAAVIPMQFTVAGAMTGNGALASNIPLALTAAGSFSGSAALSSTIALAFSESGALTGNGRLITTIPLTISAGGILTGQGALAATIPIAAGVSGALTNNSSGALNGLVSMSLGVVSQLGGGGRLQAAIPISLGANGVLNGFAPLLTNITMSTSVGGTLSGSVTMSSTIALSMGLTGLMSGAGQLGGVVPLSMLVGGQLQGQGALASSMQMTLTLVGGFQVTDLTRGVDITLSAVYTAAIVLSAEAQSVFRLSAQQE